MSVLASIEVGGHITHNTTWSPRYNPYLVNENVYVDAGVTLTILPGVEVRIKSADKNNWDDFSYEDGIPPIAKMIRVSGKIIAKGTETHPILFDKQEANPNYRWGSIGITSSAPESEFEYCVFKNSYCIYENSPYYFLGAISFYNGILSIRHCKFYNNIFGLDTVSLNTNLLIYDCEFFVEPNLYIFNYTFLCLDDLNNTNSQNYQVTIANCRFVGRGGFNLDGNYHVLWLNNEFTNIDNSCEMDAGSTSYYGNRFLDGHIEANLYSMAQNDSVFFRKNYARDYGEYGLQSRLFLSTGNGKNFISENVFLGNSSLHVFANNEACRIEVNNNRILTKKTFLLFDGFTIVNDERIKIYNNIFVSEQNYNTVFAYDDSIHPKIFNNNIINYYKIFTDSDENNSILINNIVTGTVWYLSTFIFEEFHPIFSYNCLSIPIPDNLFEIDGGNNIVADPMFVGVGRHPYALQENSPCIDSGLNLPELPPYDIAYNKRISSGALNGDSLIVDRGAYEYNSVYVGGMRVIVRDAGNGQLIDCVKARINGFLPEFTDSLGFIHFVTMPGEFDVTFSRWDYLNQTLHVSVIEGEDTPVTVYLQRTNAVSSDDESLSAQNAFILNNYPNPFNPSTTISWQMPEEGQVEVSIFNIKGQKVKTLCNQRLARGQHQIVWDGREYASGVYFVRLQAGNQTLMRKILMMK